jgi:hypothetical protein
VDNLARQLNSEQVLLAYGKVIHFEEPYFRIETGSGIQTATKSFTCLVEPLPGDMVLISQDMSGKCYILNILERDDASQTSLVFDGDVELKAKAGRLQLAAQEGIDLVSAKETALVSPALSVSTMQAEVHCQHLSFLGTYFHGQIEKIKLIGQACDSIFDRVSQRVRRSYRWVSELEQLRAGQLIYHIKKLMSLRGKYSVLTAEEDVRIDGDKILMG